MEEDVGVQLGRIDIRVSTVEREISDLKHHNENHRNDDGKRWDSLLIAFGELKAKVEGMNGRMAGYLIAGMLLAAVVSVLANKVFSDMQPAQSPPHAHQQGS
jgi:hypothetical protein